MTSTVAFLTDAWLAVAVHLWQTTLVLLPILLLSRWLRSAPARVVHLIWSVAFLKIVLPMAVFGDLVGRAASFVTARFSMAAGSPMVATLDAVNAVVHPDVALRLGSTEPGGLIGISIVVLTSLWFAGVLRALIRLLREHRSAVCPDVVEREDLPWKMREKLDSATDGTSIPIDRLQVSTARVAPHVAGLLRPMIYVSGELIDALTATELRAVLLHEESHRRRFDPLRSAIQRLPAALFFFYPLLSLLLRRLQQANELVCDENVVRAGVTGETYARALARTVRFGLAPRVQPFAAGVGGGALLRLRFERLTNPWRFSMMPSHRVIFALVIIFVAVGTFMPLPIAAEDRDEKQIAAKTTDKDEELPLDKHPVIIDSTLVRPEYPEAEKKEGIQGTVVLLVEVTDEGLVGTVEVDQAVPDHPAFSVNAIDAIRKWRFVPGEMDGKPVTCKVKIPIKYALDDSKH